MPVRLEQDPAADLERDGHRLPQPGLRILGTCVLQGEDRETGDEVLDLEVAVAGPLEPRSRLKAEAVALLGPAAVVRDPPEPRGRLGLDPMAAELGRDLEAAAELVLRGREIVAHEQRSDP